MDCNISIMTSSLIRNKNQAISQPSAVTQTHCTGWKTAEDGLPAPKRYVRDNRRGRTSSPSLANPGWPRALPTAPPTWRLSKVGRDAEGPRVYDSRLRFNCQFAIELGISNAARPNKTTRCACASPDAVALPIEPSGRDRWRVRPSTGKDRRRCWWARAMDWLASLVAAPPV